MSAPVRLSLALVTLLTLAPLGASALTLRATTPEGCVRAALPDAVAALIHGDAEIVEVGVVAGFTSALVDAP